MNYDRNGAPQRRPVQRQLRGATRKLDEKPMKPDSRSDPARMSDRHIRRMLCHCRGRGCSTCGEPCGYGREFLKRQQEGRWMKDETK